MTKRTPPLKPHFEELLPLLITAWRKLHDLPLRGPLDRLQTREFRSLVDAVIRGQKEKTLSDKDLIGAYFLYDWILHYAQGLSLIQELPEPPRRVLDLFCKGAPFSLAALQHGAREVFALDSHAELLKIGSSLCGRLGYPISTRTHDCLDVRLPVEGKWDLIILGYGLCQLDHPERYISSLFRYLSEGGHLLLIESSAQADNRKFLALRDLLVEKGARIQAPCIWKGSCPALKHSSSVCYAQRPFEKPYLIKEVQRAAQINLSSLKMSYLIVKGPSQSPPSQLPEKRLYRIVSPPIETFRGPRYFICGTDGKKTLGTRLKIHPKHSKAFEYLKRGDLISIHNPLEVKEDLEITEATELKLEAPCGKPI